KYCFRQHAHALITGLPFGLGFKISTSYFNLFLQKFGQKHKGVIKVWFSVGAIISIVLLPLISYLFLITGLQQVKIIVQKYYNEGLEEKPFLLQPVLPGVNIPFGDAIYCLAAIFISSLVHEFGHAVAATSEHLTIDGAGFLVFLIIPAAFVELPSYDLRLLSTFSKIRIFTAGVWNNIVLAVIAWIAILCLPIFLCSIYQIDSGVLVTAVLQDSAISGENGLQVMNVIQSVNDCQVQNKEKWRACLLEAVQAPAPGFCISEAADFLNKDNNTATLANLYSSFQGLCIHLPSTLKYYKEGEFKKEYDRKMTVSSINSFLLDPLGAFLNLTVLYHISYAGKFILKFSIFRTSLNAFRNAFSFLHLSFVAFLNLTVLYHISYAGKFILKFPRTLYTSAIYIEIL
ncbi:hypothetical protein QYM36_007111, partial [Artemia franciscana]